jgi:glycosyltransferase involved in cell wall biosynthesis
MRVAFVSPLPPEPTGIADYSYELLEELGKLVEVTAVVRDDRLDSARAPAGIEVIGINAHDARAYDTTVYQMGNNPKYHRFMFGRALDEPGLLVLHDPSLADFHAELCAGAESRIFRDEIAYDRPDIGRYGELPRVDAGEGRRDLDRFEIMLARRIVDANIRTLVHSHAVAELMRDRYAGADIHTIQLAAQIIELPRRAPDGEVVFGVFGGINYYKRIAPVVDAFALLRKRFDNARLVIAGRPDDRLLTRRIKQIAARPELDGSLEVLTDLSLPELEAQMARCDVAISLRWPTAGEMSATLIRTFGAGRPAIVSDVLQFRELDERFCWRVSTDFAKEEGALLSLMTRVLENPSLAQEAGALARSFVAERATYKKVAESYVEHLEHCARHRRRARRNRRPMSLNVAARPVVNVIALGLRESPCAEIAAAWTRYLTDCGVLAELHVVDSTDLDWNAEPIFDRPISRLMTEELPIPPDDGSRPARIARRLGIANVDLVVIDQHRLEHAAALIAERRVLGRKQIIVPAPYAVAVDNRFRPVLRLADVVWASSALNAEIIEVLSAAPVEIHRLRANAVPKQPPPGRHVFVTVFDARSGFARANPHAVIEGFLRAFSGRERLGAAALVVGCRSRLDDAERIQLVQQLAAAGGELLENLDDAAIDALFSRAHSYVSAERADDLDVLADRAMAHGLSLIVPAFQGLSAQPSAEISFVDARTMDVLASDWYLDGHDDRIAKTGQFWFDPDVDALSQAMLRRVGPIRPRNHLSSPGQAAEANVYRTLQLLSGS